MNIVKKISFLFLLISAQISFAQINVDFYASDSLGCDEMTISFVDSTTSTYNIQKWNWDFGNGTSSTDQHPTLIDYDEPGSYSVKLVITDVNGLVDSLIKDLYIVIHETPEAQFLYTDTIYHTSFAILFENQSVLLDTIDYTTLWTFGDDSLSYRDTIIHHYTQEGSYDVNLIITDHFGCSDTATQSIVIKDRFEIPNVFTPNGDGINDVLYVEANGETVFEFIVFNRYGTIMHKATAKNIYWDGRTTYGVEAGTGVYYYSIKDVNGDSRYQKTGFVHLFR